jgi:hypothetical protein
VRGVATGDVGTAKDGSPKVSSLQSILTTLFLGQF